jgi:tetratricopeptide (TPR) repeat protein
MTEPRPIGVFALPFGHLLLPDGEETAEVRAGLLAGRLPERWPAALRGHELALAEDFDGALAAFAGDGPIERYNRFVIEPGAVDAEALRRDLPDLAVLIDLVRFGTGQIDDPPAVPADGDLRSLVLAAHAAASAGAGTASGLADGVDLLESAVASVPPAHPALSGVLYGALGQMQRQCGRTDAAVASLTAGIRILTGTDLTFACADQHLSLATLYHEQAGDRADLLHPAVHHYHCVLQTIDEAGAPALFATAHANLASAYLTMPMVEASDNLRLGVAVGSLRAALGVFTREHYPRQWASAQLNLANALVYAPSTHQGDNLVEAVELYEAVLQTRDRDQDPLGLARVLANQGNALAHLGLFEHAWGKLAEARFIFEEFDEYDAVTSVRGLLDEIVRQRNAAAAAAETPAEAEPVRLGEPR